MRQLTLKMLNSRQEKNPEKIKIVFRCLSDTVLFIMRGLPANVNLRIAEFPCLDPLMALKGFATLNRFRLVNVKNRFPAFRTEMECK